MRITCSVSVPRTASVGFPRTNLPGSPMFLEGFPATTWASSSDQDWI
jgi:hypothetical protein